MSYIIMIRRAAGKPWLTAMDFTELVRNDPSLSGGDLAPIIWTNPANGLQQALHIEPEAGRLWAEDPPKDIAALRSFLKKMRRVARKLDARVYGVGGEDITTTTPISATGAAWVAIPVCIIAFIAMVVAAINSDPPAIRNNGSKHWQPHEYRPRAYHSLPPAAELEAHHERWATINGNGVSLVYTAMLGNPARQSELVVEYKDVDGPLGLNLFTFASYRYHDPTNGTYIITWSMMGRHKPEFMKLERTPRLHWLAPTSTELQFQEGIPVLEIVGVEGVPQFCSY